MIDNQEHKMSIDKKRRVFLSGSLAAGALGLTVGAGLLTPRSVLAVSWPAPSFESRDLNEAMLSLLGSDQAVESTDIALKVPEIADNGAVVPIKITTDIENIDSITIFALKNPVPLVASFQMGEGAIGLVSTRIKMGGTADVVAVVKANGKLHSARKSVKVTVGGCGG